MKEKLSDRIRGIWNRRRAVIIAVGVVLLAVIVIVVIALSRGNRAGTSRAGADGPVAFSKDGTNYVWGTPTPDPKAEATIPPEDVQLGLIGDWQRGDAETAGLVGLRLHGDGTAVYVTNREHYNQEEYRVEMRPTETETRWTAGDGYLTLVTDGGEVTQFSMKLTDNTMELTSGSGTMQSVIAFERVTAD